MTDADRHTGAAGWIGDPVVVAPDVPGDVGLDPHEFAGGPGLDGRPDGALPGAATVPYWGGRPRTRVRNHAWPLTGRDLRRLRPLGRVYEPTEPGSHPSLERPSVGLTRRRSRATASTIPIQSTIGMVKKPIAAVEDFSP